MGSQTVLLGLGLLFMLLMACVGASRTSAASTGPNGSLPAGPAASAGAAPNFSTNASPPAPAAAPSPPPKPDAELAVQLCISACNRARNAGRDLTSGPCLSDPMEGLAWVCDVAHGPRQDVDDRPENQCASYGSDSDHFVEVTPACALIRVQ